MARLASKLQAHGRSLRRGDLGTVCSDLRRWAWSDLTSYGLRCQVDDIPPRPAARIGFTVRPLDAADLDRVLPVTGLPTAELRYVHAHRRMWEEGLRTPYAGWADDGRPCYVGWLVDGATQREAVRRLFGGLFPVLGDGEALIEASWVPPHSRGLGVMAPAVNDLIRVAARLPGVTSAVTYIDHGNEPSVRGAVRAGFRVEVARHERWRLFRRRLSWEPASRPEPAAAA
jgi:hypothetical protein